MNFYFQSGFGLLPILILAGIYIILQKKIKVSNGKELARPNTLFVGTALMLLGFFPGAFLSLFYAFIYAFFHSSLSYTNDFQIVAGYALVIIFIGYVLSAKTVSDNFPERTKKDNSAYMMLALFIFAIILGSLWVWVSNRGTF
ncbi:MAG: hypothetical protein AAB805_01495 [Patescibacteria group bacterium]